jgi:hypothetical protein
MPPLNKVVETGIIIVYPNFQRVLCGNYKISISKIILKNLKCFKYV